MPFITIIIMYCQDCTLFINNVSRKLFIAIICSLLHVNILLSSGNEKRDATSNLIVQSPTYFRVCNDDFAGSEISEGWQ